MLSSKFNLFIILATVSFVVSSGKCITFEFIPTSTHLLILFATYLPEAKSSPTLTIAKVGL